MVKADRIQGQLHLGRVHLGVGRRTVGPVLSHVHSTKLFTWKRGMPLVTLLHVRPTERIQDKTCCVRLPADAWYLVRYDLMMTFCDVFFEEDVRSFVFSEEDLCVL